MFSTGWIWIDNTQGSKVHRRILIYNKRNSVVSDLRVHFYPLSVLFNNSQSIKTLSLTQRFHVNHLLFYKPLFSCCNQYPINFIHHLLCDLWEGESPYGVGFIPEWLANVTSILSKTFLPAYSHNFATFHKLASLLSENKVISKKIKCLSEAIKTGPENTKAKSMKWWCVKRGLCFHTVWRLQHKTDEFILHFAGKTGSFSETILSHFWSCWYIQIASTQAKSINLAPCRCITLIISDLFTTLYLPSFGWWQLSFISLV